jgi:hypothetical protein
MKNNGALGRIRCAPKDRKDDSARNRTFKHHLGFPRGAKTMQKPKTEEVRTFKAYGVKIMEEVAKEEAYAHIAVETEAAVLF